MIKISGIHGFAVDNYKNDVLHTLHALDEIYHSNSMDEMQVKADLYSIDLMDCDVLMFLIDTTTYHHAFWPHTAKRFTAFKKLLKTFKDLPGRGHLKEIFEHIDDKIQEHADNKWIMSTPGGKQEVKNLKQVRKILERLEEDHARRR